MNIYVKEVAAKYGLKLNEVCERCGYKSQPSFSRQINNPDTLNMKTLIRIAEAIGCEVTELLMDPNGQEIPAPSIVCPHCGKVIKVAISAEQA